jgi:hypothetical protein
MLNKMLNAQLQAFIWENYLCLGNAPENIREMKKISLQMKPKNRFLKIISRAIKSVSQEMKPVSGEMKPVSGEKSRKVQERRTPSHER